MQIFNDLNRSEESRAIELFNDFLDEMAHECGYIAHDEWDNDDWDEFEDMIVDAVRYRR